METLKSMYAHLFRRQSSKRSRTSRTAMGMTTPENIFREFCKESDFKDVLSKFKQMKSILHVTDAHSSVYHTCRGRINTSEARTLWRNLDKRASGSAYKDGQACAGKRMLVIGAGPCGLRMAIEGALLGARVVVVEMRDYVTRNNVLHLWPFVIHDMKGIGARVFKPKFCVGSREHVSIKSMQQILLKIALVLGVEVQAPVKFEGLVEPGPDSTGEVRGWRATFTPADHNLRNYEFDVLIGADGKSNTIQDFKRQVFRGKLAIAITANFVNKNSPEDNAVEEIGGLFYVFNQPFFDGLRDRGGIVLENLVYFKDDTHYFVMTARKHSLLAKGVLREDYSDSQRLLAPENINRQSLLAYARETAELSTNHQLPNLQFALDHRGHEDVALFDFTNLHQAHHACLVRERRGRQLVMGIVGDTLIEPFWPTGSGCARGFLSIFDTAWMIKGWAAGQPILDVIAEREAVLQLLSQTKPDNLNMRLTEYTIDPRTRYGPKLGRIKKLSHPQVAHLCDIEGAPPEVTEKPKLPPRTAPRKRTYDATLNRKRLLAWYQRVLQPVADLVNVTDLTSSWRNGLALLALVDTYRPGLIDVRSFSPQTATENNQKAFDLIVEHFGIGPTLPAESLATAATPDRLAILSYLTQLQQQLETEKRVQVPKVAGTKRKVSSLLKKVSSVGMLARLARRTSKKITARGSIEKRPRLPPRGPRPERLSRSATLDKCKGIAAKRIRAFQSGGQDQADGAPPLKALSSAEVCCICRKRLYVSERQNANGYFFHRSCFHCFICDATLWSHSFHAETDGEGQVIFLCPDHAPVGPEPDEAAAHLLPTEPTIPEDEVEEMDISEMARLVSPDMMASDDLMGMASVMGMASGFSATAVAEEEDSEDELTTDTEGMALSSDTDHVDAKTPRTHSKFYTLATSMRLMVGYEIQRELEEMETEEQELESRGVTMERNLRNRQSVIDPTAEVSSREELVQEWMDVVRQTQEVRNKQTKLVLKAKLMELQERHQRLQRQLQRICEIDDLEEDMEALAALTENLSDEVNDTVKQILELRLFLKQSGETEA